jgi:MFS transporter, FSR family, fosmidomycin resistance protein
MPSNKAHAGTRPSAPVEERRTLAAAGIAHILHDGYTDLLYLLLPIWQAEFGLGYAEVGLLRSSYTGVMAALQIPAALLAERCGPVLLLVAGTLVSALAFLLAGASVGLVSLLLVLILGGIGASVQHPIGSSLVSAAFTGARSRTALGVYNFTGDLGKMAMPLLAALLLSTMPWRSALLVLGGLGIACAVLVLALAPAQGNAPRRDGEAAAPLKAASSPPEAPSRQGFLLLMAIAMIDSAGRSGFLTFLPFLLKAKEASIASIGSALSLLFVGGAAGKLVCGYLGARVGLFNTVLLTEGLTAIGIIALIPLPMAGAFMLMPLLGIGLNGTSSALYGTVPELVAPARRTRAFGIFYTGAIAASAAMPPLIGLIGDGFGVATAMLLIAVAVLSTVPLAALLLPMLPTSGRSALDARGDGGGSGH